MADQRDEQVGRDEPVERYEPPRVEERTPVRRPLIGTIISL
jgi:hypothetical protein